MADEYALGAGTEAGDAQVLFAYDTDTAAVTPLAKLVSGSNPYFDIFATAKLDGVLFLDRRAAKANTAHTHEITDVVGLASALSGKSALGHTHAISDVSGLQTALDSKLEAFTPEPAIADADDSLTLLSILNVHTEINADRAKINEILAVLRAQGMIAE